MQTRAPLYQLEVTILEIQPAIRHRLVVPPHLSLPRLHAVLQIAMGWRNEHLHAFEVGQVRFGTPDPDFPDNTLSGTPRAAEQSPAQTWRPAGVRI